jgi:predicted regulator of Ras-like GTPase activity (Roadblock/LC7/MglB family)
MLFRENLSKVVDNVEGGVAGLLMGFDGIAVETYSRPQAGLDINTIGMEFSFILTQVRKAAEVLEVGGVQEVAIRAENLSIIVRVLNHDYFLALALGPNGNFGKGRYLLRMVAPKITTELS